jgi:dTDP-4-amino-4,6-dideoxygalactose transaminase
MSTHEPIPFLDLATPHRELESELLESVRDCLRSASFIGGPKVEEFERNFAQFCGTSYCIGVANGTDAVRFALMGAGVKPGDVVITVPHTFIATTEAISQAGARPDFVDVDEQTYCMDPLRLRHYLETQCVLDPQTGRLIHRNLKAPVTAVVPVHLYGHVADMDPILDLARKYNLIVVEDACQAHGAEYFSQKDKTWKKAGSMGHAAAFSFYPGKNLGACGEAGAVTTNDQSAAKMIRMLRDHGQAQKYYHQVEGYNGRLDALQAGLLTIKLRHLPEWNEKRREAARMYDRLLAEVDGVIAPQSAEYSRSVYHLYVVRVSDRAALQHHLNAAGIGTGIHYPVPLHLQAAYQHLGYAQGSFPVSERVAAEILSLPMFPQLREAQIKRVVLELSNSLPQAQPRAAAESSKAQPVAL